MQKKYLCYRFLPAQKCLHRGPQRCAILGTQQLDAILHRSCVILHRSCVILHRSCVCSIFFSHDFRAKIQDAASRLVHVAPAQPPLFAITLFEKWEDNRLEQVRDRCEALLGQADIPFEPSDAAFILPSLFVHRATVFTILSLSSRPDRDPHPHPTAGKLQCRDDAAAQNSAADDMVGHGRTS